MQIAWLRLWRKQVGGVSGADQYRAFVSIIGASELWDYEYGLPLFVEWQGKAIQRVPIRQVGPERLFLLRVHTCQGRNKRCASDKCKNRARLSRPDDRQAGWKRHPRHEQVTVRTVNSRKGRQRYQRQQDDAQGHEEHRRMEAALHGRKTQKAEKYNGKDVAGRFGAEEQFGNPEQLAQGLAGIENPLAVAAHEAPK